MGSIAAPGDAPGRFEGEGGVVVLLRARFGLAAGRMHVLLIDDDPHVRRLGAAALRSAGGVEVVCASSGANGVALAEVSRPDVVLLDVNMSGEDGPTTLARLRVTPGLSDVPVIFFTAEQSAGRRDGLIELGAAGVIAKPFDPVSLAREVREVLARYRAEGAGNGG